MKWKFERYEQIISALLWYGTWSAVAAVALGLIMGVNEGAGAVTARAGIALFILLPIIRVALLLVAFLKEKDFVYVAISMSVLTIIIASVVVGFYRVSIHL